MKPKDTKLNISDNKIDYIQSSGVIHHTSNPDNILKELYRVLKPGGIFRVATPDFNIITKLLHEGYSLKEFLGPLYGKMNMGSKIIYHKTTYNYNDLKTLLSECGFSKVNFYNWKNTEHSNFDDHSQAYIPHMDKENGTLISLNVEATK